MSKWIWYLVNVRDLFLCLELIILYLIPMNVLSQHFNMYTQS